MILSVGRLVEFKDHKTLIQAFAKISAEFPDWRVRIVGDGHLKGSLESLVAELNVKGRVLFIEPTKHIEREYANAELFVIPSYFEGYGLVTAEALSAGLPCIGFAN